MTREHAKLDVIMEIVERTNLEMSKHLSRCFFLRRLSSGIIN